jgi:hypothetical protein
MATFKPLSAGSWRNADGLIVYFGPTEGTPGNGGEYRSLGPNRVQESIVDLTQLTSSAVYLDQHFEIPKNAFIEQVVVEVLVAATSGGSATLNVGLKGSDQSTNVSDTALVNAAALATINAAGDKLTLVTGATGAGSSIGTALAANGLVTVKYGTAAFTAGRILIRVEYNFLPLA